MLEANASIQPPANPKVPEQEDVLKLAIQGRERSAVVAEAGLDDRYPAPAEESGHQIESLNGARRRKNVVACQR